jgi:hypothetical protein
MVFNPNDRLDPELTPGIREEFITQMEQDSKQSAQAQEEKAQKLSSQPQFSATDAELELLGKRLVSLKETFTSGDADRISDELADLFDTTQILGARSSLLKNKDAPLYTPEELRKNRTILYDRFGEVEGESRYRQMVNRQQNVFQNGAEDLKDVIIGLTVGLPTAGFNTIYDTVDFGIKSIAADNEKDKVKYAKAAGASATQLVDAIGGGMLASANQMTRGYRGIKEAPLEVALGFADVSGLAKAGKAAKIARSEGKSLKGVAKEAARGYSEGSKLPFIDILSNTVSKMYEKAKPGSWAKKAAGGVNELFFDPDAKAMQEFREVLLDADEGMRSDFWKTVNSFEEINHLEPAALSRLDEALRFGDDPRSIRNAEAAVGLMAKLSTLLEQIQRAEIEGAEARYADLMEDYTFAREALDGRLEELKTKPLDEIPADQQARELMNSMPEMKKVAEQEARAAKKLTVPGGPEEALLGAMEQGRVPNLARAGDETKAMRNAKIRQTEKEIKAAEDAYETGTAQADDYVSGSIKEGERIMSDLQKAVKTEGPAAKRDKALAVEIAKAKRLAKDGFDIDMDLVKDIEKSSQAKKKSKETNIVSWMQSNKNPYMEFTYDGVPMNNIAFFFDLEHKLKEGKFDPGKIEAKALKPEYEEIVNVALDIRKRMAEMSLEQNKINVGKADAPVPFLTEKTTAYNIPSYLSDTRRASRMGLEKLEAELDLLQKQAVGMDDLSAAAAAQYGPDVIANPISSRQRKDVARRTDIDDAAKREEFRLRRGADDFVLNLQTAVSNTQKEMHKYKLFNKIYNDQIVGGADISPASKYVFDTAQEALAVIGDKSQNRNFFKKEMVQVPEIKTEPGNPRSPYLYGPLSGKFMRRAEFEALNRVVKTDNFIRKTGSILAEKIARYGAKDLQESGARAAAKGVADLYTGGIKYSRSVNTVANPVYFANTVSGYMQMLALQDVNPLGMFTNMKKNVSRDNIYLKKFLESGVPEGTAFMYGALDQAGINPSAIGLGGLGSLGKRSAKRFFSETGADMKAWSKITDDIAKAKQKITGNKEAQGKFSKLAGFGAQLGKSMPKLAVDMFTGNGFNSAVAGLIDVSARATLFEALVKRKAKALKVDPSKVLANEALVKEIARQTDKDMVNYKNMGRANAFISKYHPTDPFHSWWVRSTSHLFNTMGNRNVLARGTKQLEKSQKAMMSERLKELRKNLPQRVRGAILSLPTTANPDLWLQLTYSSIYEPSMVDPAKLATLGLALEPKTERDMLQRKLAMKKSGPAQALTEAMSQTLSSTDMGWAKLWNNMSGRKDYYSQETDPTMDTWDIRRVSAGVKDMALPNLWNFYASKEFGSFWDEAQQKKNLDQTGELRSSMMNLTPAELVLRSLGLPITRMDPTTNKARWTRAFDAVKRDINSKFKNTVRKSARKSDEEKAEDTRILKQEAIQAYQDLVEEFMNEGFY